MDNLPRLPDVVGSRTFLNENQTTKPTFRLRYVTATPRETAQNLLRFQTKKCILCKGTVNEQDSCYLIWEDRCFCDLLCLKLYQKQKLKQSCAYCFKTLPEDLVGRFVFRYDQLLQFCSIPCFQRFQSKKRFCLYCMGKVLNLSYRVNRHDPKFCSQDCATKHLTATRHTHVPLQSQTVCSVCKTALQPIMIHYQIENEVKNICNQFCLQTFIISNRVKPEQCVSCKMYFTSTPTSIKMIHEDAAYMFCSEKCVTYYVFKSQLIYPCDYCKTARFDTDLIKRYSRLEPPTYLCSIICYLKKYSPKGQHLTAAEQQYSVMPGQQYSLPLQQRRTLTKAFRLPLISRTPLSTIVENVQEPLLNPMKPNDNMAHTIKEAETNYSLLGENTTTYTENSPAQIKTCFIVKPEYSPGQINVATMCSISKVDKSSCIKPQDTDQWVQTDTQSQNTILIPVPVPIYVATPVHMFSVPVPSPVPFPLPIPVPVFIPITRKSYKKIFEDIEKIKEKIPTDPMQADILQIAEALSSDANKELEENLTLSEQAINEMFSDDLLESGLNMCNDSNVVSSTVDNNSTNLNEGTCNTIAPDASTSISKPARPKQEQTNYLETSLGIYAWRQWIKKTKSIVANRENTNILKLPPTEIGSCLALFITEIKRPNGKNYAPDTIFYLCLSIQKYLFENNRSDNIFFDNCYKDFVEELDYHMRSYPVLFLDSAYIVTRVEEEHLWESRHLGAHSPFILLNTFLYHNMKYFNLMSIEENMSLSFSSIVKKEYKQDTSKTILRLYKGEEGHYSDMPQNLKNRERCPVKLFEFYLLKVPIDRQQNNHSSYLQPDSSCTGIDPVWYSIEPLARDDLEIMINRLKVVKELNIPIEI